MMDAQRFPRLARAVEQERAYQTKKRDQRRKGIVTMDVACEEMVRSFRVMGREFGKRVRALAR